MTRRDDIVAFANELLDVESFPEYGRPGLQVLGADEVTKLACGVSTPRELFERAAAAGAQLVLVPRSASGESQWLQAAAARD